VVAAAEGQRTVDVDGDLVIDHLAVGSLDGAGHCVKAIGNGIFITTQVGLDIKKSINTNTIT
ncbi:MAG: hypothetical protein J5747_07730, partial [Spirochaetaceae bacterium]|nr:hypothetical protein [Spirochaetaceae bacterium]